MNNFKNLAVPGVQLLKPYIPGKPIDELERELGIKNSIKLVFLFAKKKWENICIRSFFCHCKVNRSVVFEIV